MSALPWKLSTFAAVGAAAYLAIHPVRSTDKASPGKASATSSAESTPASGGMFGWFGGSAAAAPASSSAKMLAQLRSAHSSTAICEAARALAYNADDEVTSAIADVAQKGRADARACAIEALGNVRLSAARSWLADLTGDRDSQIRGAAIQALAARPDDPEARALVMTIAKTGDRDARLTALFALGNAHVAEATPLLLAAIDGEDLDTQRQLVAAIGSGDATAVDALATISRDAPAAIRNEALSALGKIGGDKAVAVLTEALGASRGGDAAVAAQALAEIGDPAAKRALIDAAGSDRHDVALAALGALADVEGQDVRALMLKELGAGRSDESGAAARYFRNHRDESVVPDLLRLARHGGRDGGTEAMQTLVAIGGDAARAGLAEIAGEAGASQASALQQLAQMPGGHDEARKISLSLLRTGGPAAQVALGVLGNDGSPEARRALIDAARAGDATSSEAMSALAQRGDPESVRTLQDLAQNGKDAGVKTQALSALGMTGDPTATATLTRALGSKDPDMQRAAIHALSMVRGPEAEKALLDATSSADASLRVSAVRALGRNASGAVAAQLEKLANDPDRNVAHTAFWGLATSAPDKAAKIAEDQMKSAEVDMRRSAVQMSNMLEPDRAREVLLTGLRDVDPSVAVVAARGLTQVGDVTSQNALAALLTRDDAPAEVRRAAADALRDIGGDTAQRFADLIATTATPLRHGRTVDNPEFDE